MGVLNEKPPVEAGAGAASLLAAPNINEDGADGVGSLFSSGFPKVNVGAAFTSFSDVKDPKVAPPGVVEEVKLPNIEDVLVADVLTLVEDGAGLSLFSCEDPAKVTVDGVELLSVDFSSGFDCPNVKPPLVELLSVLVEPVPKFIPPLVPNLNPELAAGGSDVLSLLEAVPNLKPSEEVSNLNPDEGALVSLEVVSDEELPKAVPNLNPPEVDDDDAEASGKIESNLNPPDPLEGAVLSAVPNLKPPAANVEELDVPFADEPKVVPEVLSSTLAPGLAVVQATH